MSDGLARLELCDITKSFPGVLANDTVSFKIMPGEIHALLGENGAGKSTLVKMIYGVMQPNAGSILWEGKDMVVANPQAARKMGIGMVFQHFSLFEAMTVLENIALGLDAKVSHRELEQKIAEILRVYGLKLDPHRVVHTLSVGERQRIEIVRALLLKPRLLIMDEPTSVLTPQEVSQLFKTLRQLAQTGCSILYISHKLHEIKALCETATILRGGKVVGGCNPRQESSKSMAEMMIGGDLKQTIKDKASVPGEIAFETRNMCQPKRGDFGTALEDVNLTVRSGEVFGIAGVAGNGQSELFLALSGEHVCDQADAICMNKKSIGDKSIVVRRSMGLCAVPEERNGHAAVVDFTLTDNAVLSARARMGLTNAGFIRYKKAADYARKVISRFKVKATGCQANAGSLSGGNLQKYVVGREIMQEPSVLIVAQPTWGVDAGAAAAIHQALLDLAALGSAIIVISQDLDELLNICDEIAVINEGKLSRRLKVGEASVDEIGLLMGGGAAVGQEETYAN